MIGRDPRGGEAKGGSGGVVMVDVGPAVFLGEVVAAEGRAARLGIEGGAVARGGRGPGGCGGEAEERFEVGWGGRVRCEGIEAGVVRVGEPGKGVGRIVERGLGSVREIGGVVRRGCGLGG